MAFPSSLVSTRDYLKVRGTEKPKYKCINDPLISPLSSYKGVRSAITIGLVCTMNLQVARVAPKCSDMKPSVRVEDLAVRGCWMLGG